jgi:hypothetical protein
MVHQPILRLAVSVDEPLWVTSAANVGDPASTTPASIEVMRRFICSSWCTSAQNKLILNLEMTPTAGTDAAFQRQRDRGTPRWQLLN